MTQNPLHHLCKFLKMVSFSESYHKKHLEEHLHENELDEQNLWIEPLLRDYREYQYEVSAN